MVSLSLGLEFVLQNSAKRSPSSANSETAVNAQVNTASPIDLPPYGRSNFDIVFSKKENNRYVYDIPFPIDKFLERLEAYTGKQVNSSDSSGIVSTLFPMGRSLQRDAAIRAEPTPSNPDLYFKFPRVVIGVDGESESNSKLTLNLKNKFYAGYNEKAEALEIISYNEVLGRFEYQTVSDYAAGKVPQVRYASRGLCLGCHQNQAPIFAKAPWSESNASPAVSNELLRVLGKDHYFRTQITADQSFTSRLDTSTDQANLLPVYQNIWKDLCAGDVCRKSLLSGVLQLRLNRSHLFANNTEITNWMNEFESSWQKTWPAGLSILSADIPDRDPFRDVTENSPLGLENFKKQFSTAAESLAQSKIPAAFEPLVPRNPSEVWSSSGPDPVHGNRLIKGLSKEFTQQDIIEIDNWLNRTSAADVKTRLRSSCSVERIQDSLSINCKETPENAFSFSVLLHSEATEATVSKFTFKSSGEELTATGLTAKFNLSSGTAGLSLKSKDQISLRTPKGFSLSDVEINLSTGEATSALADQSRRLQQLIDNWVQSLKTSEGSFSRFTLMKSFYDLSGQKIAVEDIVRHGLPAELNTGLLPDLVDGLHPGFNLIKNNCRECHRNSEGAPVNFLGLNNVSYTDKELCQRIELCAPRMMYRLKMRLCGTDDVNNKKIPMPPDFFLSSHKIPREKWMKEYNPKILGFLNQLVNENELARDIQNSGVAQSEAIQLARDVISDKCPVSSSIMYDLLPKCEFEEPKTATRCR
jgi:hypothetical protein